MANQAKSKKTDVYSSAVSLDPHRPDSGITLSPVVLNQLKRMSPGALKVYIHLCACYKGQRFSASIPQIQTATGLENRSVIAALKVLREKKLITRTSGRGNKPNQYDIPLPKHQETAAHPIPDTTPPSPALKQATPPAATPMRAITPEPITAPPSAKRGQATASSPSPTQGTIPELPKHQENAAHPIPNTTPLSAALKQAAPPVATPMPAITPEPIAPRSPEVIQKGNELKYLLARLGFPDVTDQHVTSLLAASVEPEKSWADADLPGYLDLLLARLRYLARKEHKFKDFLILSVTVHKLYGIRE